MYDVNPKKTTRFCYTMLQSHTSGSYCIPIEPVSRQHVRYYLDSPMNTMRRAVGDLSLTIDIVILGSLISIVLAFLFFEILRRQSKTAIVVWVSIIGTTLLIFLSSYLFHVEYRKVSS